MNILTKYYIPKFEAVILLYFYLKLVFSELFISKCLPAKKEKNTAAFFKNKQLISNYVSLK